MTILTQHSLSKMACSEPDCTSCQSTLVFNQSCHPREGQTVIYEKACGHLIVLCRICEEPVAVIAVAAGGH
jgi:hypothetical protein